MVDACIASDEALPIYTLNHDCLIERTLDHHVVPYDDFLRTEGTRRILAPLPTVRDGAQAAIYKLHGSTDWRRFRPLDTPNDWFREWVGYEYDSAGRRHDDGTEWRSQRPLFLHWTL